VICPSCDAALSNKATRCVCGWRQVAERPERRHVPCAFDGCLNEGLHRVRIGPRIPGKERHNWANVCSEHDVAIVQKEADDWLRSVGLERQPDETMKAWMARTIAWLKANGEKQKRVRGFKSAADLLVSQRQREPGDDDEEVAA
jgi:hypothetical protein